MSHAVLRENPNDAQLYLDRVLDAVREKDKNMHLSVRERDKLNVAEIIYHCMKETSSDVFMINGSTGEKTTNRDILQRSVSLARTLLDMDMKGRRVMVLMRNHKQMAILYYGVLFAGVVPFMLEPNSTVYELQHFLTQITPSIVFCDQNKYDEVVSAIKDLSGVTLRVVAADNDELLEQFCGCHEDLEDFTVTDATPESAVMMLPTSGSTGLPKAAILTHQGIVAQLSSLWSYHNKFPRPTGLAMLLSTAQWMTHTILMTTCPVYNVTLLVTSEKPTAEHVLGMLQKYRPTWSLLGPAFATSLAASAEPHQLTSLETVLLTGSPPTRETLEIFKRKLPRGTHLCNGYGMTEMQSFVAIPDPTTPFGSTGKVFNTLLYKIVDQDGNELGAHQKGELYIKSDISMIKGYYNNEEAYTECLSPDGWYKTGDVFYKDDDEHLFFVERKKFWFKYLNYHVSPEELEQLIGSIPGVQECVVCGSDKGPAGAIVLRPGCKVNREQIHKVIDSSLSDYKRLHGGIAFVQSLPRTHSGKLHRINCNIFVNELIDGGQCF